MQESKSNHLSAAATERGFHTDNNLITRGCFPWLVIQTVTVPVHMGCTEHIQISSLIQLQATQKNIWENTAQPANTSYRDRDFLWT